MNEIGRGYKEMLHTKYQSFKPSSFRKKEFENGLLCSSISTCDHQGRASFDPGEHHINKLGRGLQGDIIYQSSRVPVSEKNNFEVCPLCSYVQTCDQRGGANLDPRSII